MGHTGKRDELRGGAGDEEEEQREEMEKMNKARE